MSRSWDEFLTTVELENSQILNDMDFLVVLHYVELKQILLINIPESLHKIYLLGCSIKKWEIPKWYCSPLAIGIAEVFLLAHLDMVEEFIMYKIIVLEDHEQRAVTAVHTEVCS